MDQRIEAIFENGVFRPIDTVSLPDHLRVTLVVKPNTPPRVDDPEFIARQRRAAARLNAKLEGLPDNSPDDGLSSADHDRILYGGQL